MRRCHAGSLATGLLILAWVPAHACSLGLATAVTLLTDPAGLRLLAPVEIDGTTVTMLLDTGAQVTALNRAVYHRVNTTAQIGSHLAGDDDVRRDTVSGVGGLSSANASEIDSLRLGRLHGGATVMVLDRDFDEHGTKIAGALGAEALGGYDVDVNLAGGQLRLFSAQGGDCGAHPAVLLDQPLYVVPMLPHQGSDTSAVRVMVEVNGHPLRALLDTGAESTLLFGSAARALGLRSTEDAARTVAVGGVGSDRMQASRQVLDRVAIGPIALRHVPALADPEDGENVDMLLGIDFFRRMHVWISRSSGTVVIQVPPAPSPPLTEGLR